MPTIVGVKLRAPAKPVLFDTGDADVHTDDVVVVTTEKGAELGRVVTEPEEVSSDTALGNLRALDRIATADDLSKAEEMHLREKEAMRLCRRLIAKHGLDMKPVEVEYAFDASKIVFYFSAEERVDFRDLVRDLAAELHSRIDMRQIGVRDEARIVGGLGHCGQQLCCARFAGDFQPVSIRMAKEQDLPLNPLKISGLCGRLMCCLRYEYDAYKDFKGRAPKRNAIIEVGSESGKVVDLNTPKEVVTVRMEGGKTIAVPLERMDCSCDKGCPCRVSQEVVDELTGGGLTAAVAELVAAETAVAKPEAAAAASDAPSRRKRRRGRSSGSSGQQPAAGQQQQGRGKQPQGDGRKKGQSSGQRPQGGRKEPGAAQPAPEAAAGSAQPAPKPAARRRRRRRSSGSGGGETTGPTA